MPKKKQRGQKKDSSLGHNLVRTRFQGVGRQQRGHAGDHGLVHTSDLNDGYDWGRLGATSITEQSDLSEFLSTAELAGTEFTAEKLNVTVITEMTNEALLTEEQKAVSRLCTRPADHPDFAAGPLPLRHPFAAPPLHARL